jgi:hypothetical protein
VRPASALPVNPHTTGLWHKAQPVANALGVNEKDPQSRLERWALIRHSAVSWIEQSLNQGNTLGRALALASELDWTFCNWIASRKISTSAMSDCAARHRPKPLDPHLPIRRQVRPLNSMTCVRRPGGPCPFAPGTRENSRQSTNKRLNPVKILIPPQNFRRN